MTGGVAIRCITTAATNTTTNVAAAWSTSNRARPNAVGTSVVNNAPHAAIARPANAKTAAGADSSAPNPMRNTCHNATIHAMFTTMNVTVRAAWLNSGRFDSSPAFGEVAIGAGS